MTRPGETSRETPVSGPRTGLRSGHYLAAFASICIGVVAAFSEPDIEADLEAPADCGDPIGLMVSCIPDLAPRTVCPRPTWMPGQFPYAE